MALKFYCYDDHVIIVIISPTTAATTTTSNNFVDNITTSVSLSISHDEYS